MLLPLPGPSSKPLFELARHGVHAALLLRLLALVEHPLGEPHVTQATDFHAQQPPGDTVGPALPLRTCVVAWAHAHIREIKDTVAAPREHVVGPRFP